MLSTTDFKEKHVVVVFAKEGQRLSFKNDNLIVKNKDDKTELQVTCYRLFSVWIIGNMTITSGLLERSKKYCFSIVLFSYGFKPYGYWNSTTEGNFLLRQVQYNVHAFDVSKHLMKNKIRNQGLLLKSIRSKTNYTKDALEKLKKYYKNIESCTNRESLLGIEGSASRMYFGAWFQTVDWKGRRPRAKRDPTNVLMDIGYTLLFNFVEAMLNLYGFDVYKGVYHQNFYQRKSLVCDIVEPFRVIIDKKIKVAYGLKQVKEEDFYEKNGKYTLNYKNAKPYTEWLLKGVLEYKMEIFLYVQQYYRAFIRQKPIDNYPIFDFETKKIIYENARNV